MPQSPPESISFQVAIDQAKRTSNQLVLLLGNGFSIAALNSLRYHAPRPSMTEISRRNLIDGLTETIKEINHRSLDNQPLETSVSVLQNQLSKLKGKLVGIITESHLTNTNHGTRTIYQDLNYGACVQFLDHFIGSPKTSNQIYTLNYDLMLYWTLMSTKQLKKRNFRDGFLRHNNKPLGLTTWYASSGFQNIFYLHGALHFLYLESKIYLDPNRDLYKLSGAYGSLPNQIMDYLTRGNMPLVVLEGSAEDKCERIMAHPYLKYGFFKFNKAVNECDTSLFVFGCSLNDFDKHIRDVILNGKCKIFYSTYKASPEDVNNGNYTHCKECNNKEEAYPAELSPSNTIWGQRGPTFFCAKSARVWG